MQAASAPPKEPSRTRPYLGNQKMEVVGPPLSLPPPLIEVAPLNKKSCMVADWMIHPVDERRQGYAKQSPTEPMKVPLDAE